MKRNKKTLALVGLGTWAEKGHIPIYTQKNLREKISLVAFCSRSIEKASSWAKKHNVAGSYNSYSKLLKEVKPDIVSICTADKYHTDYILEGLEAGSDIIVEKPLTTEIQESKKITETAKRLKKRIIVMFHKRSDNLWAETKSIIKTGSLGKLQMGYVSIENSLYVSAGNYFKSDMTESSNPNWFLGTHMYDLIRYMTGLNPQEVCARKYFGELESMGINSPDAIKVDMILEEGASISFLLSWNLPEKSPSITKQEITLHYQKGELILDGTRRGLTLNSDEGYKYLNPYFMRNENGRWTGYGAEYLEETINFLTDEKYNPKVSLANAEDGCWATAIASAVEESSLQNGQKVKIQQIE